MGGCVVSGVVIVGYHRVYWGEVGCVGRGRGGSGVIISGRRVYGGRVGGGRRGRDGGVSQGMRDMG